VKKIITIASVFALLFLLLAVPAFAQETTTNSGLSTNQDPWTLIHFSRYFGAAITTVGAAYGIGKLGSSALESMARQPEVAGNIQTAMIIAAALIEGFTFFALVVCFLK
jgi:F-type H+-transporting ATPase subunit c